LKSLLTQKPLEEYTGPVVFMGPAAGKLFLDLLGKGVTRAREPLSALGGNPSQYNGFLAKRFGLKILPKSYEVWDKPNEKEFNSKVLVGSIAVDDEGVKSKDIALIKNGKLVGLPMRRTATKKFSEVNGHARGSINSTPNSAITNLFIEDKNGVSQDAFMNAIKETAADQGVDQVLMVSSLKDETNASDSDEFLSMFGSGSRTRLSNPAQMVLYNIKTGEKKPVWGLEFSNVDEKNLKNIIASSKDQTLYQSLAYTSPVSIIAPDILIEEITLEKTKLEKLRTPALPMPDLK
jgi:hypothetical protein